MGFVAFSTPAADYIGPTLLDALASPRNDILRRRVISLRARCRLKRKFHQTPFLAPRQ